MLSTLIRAGSLQTMGRQFARSVETPVQMQHVRAISKSSEVNSDYMTMRENQTQKVSRDYNSKLQVRLKKVSRTLSTLNNSIPEAATQTIVTKSDAREFMAVFPDLVRDLTEYCKKYDNTLAPKWFVRALQYNVPQGKKNRGLAAVLAYRMLSKSEDLTPENIRRAHYLGWVIEMFQSVFLICDDAMDGSQTRRGQPCWYKLEDVKLSGINDALMIDAAIFYVLKKQFGDEPYYSKLVETFNEIKFITTIGQSLDLRSARMDVTKYTMDLYKSIVCHKTAYYTFYLPVALAMHMTGFTDPEVFRQTKTILLEIGLFYQTQDDFLDCFGDPAVTGKIGTDIEEGKCTWLSVVAMQRASDEQKELMKQCYGSSDPEKVARVKKLYEELGLPTTYAIYEEESYNMIKTHIQQISRGLPHELFFKIMEKIYRRDC
ncbi:farnesyl pyrophosphate synthase [Aedes albopictus]|uniref:Farnesyl pyrophosphate synthase n=2 Tax=Aedes albopictus TaxID=7160 RepID=A0A023ES27_AEDAL|nr:farnesyl pyrophosphate synthase-like [Aedes albopictus]XP_029728705.1 farnesyl pyrophosphate synthase-like [Aedes albopictus]XP_029728706.1 farnesyl pyrophosphate synthase-like [Aedes albopictus]XP_029728707.1 farnesyl pyrophosphate synthase-like [Aedes albopictus]XP_029728757.1 LOW QUALITY PROTEIN: farnesyl pyrophosphate synthase [Aedes albopictus]